MSLQNTFVHHVHFWLKNKEDQQKLFKGLNSLRLISVIKEMQVGIPADTYRDVVDRSYDASLLILFDTPEDQVAYQDDPTHLLFVENYAKPLCAKIVVQDSVSA